jgi:Ca2+-binding EF-hand superfamily protein
VSYQEFTVAMLFMLYRGSADDNVDVAFKMFDTNRSGSISKAEFNDMICSIIGVRLSTVLDNPVSTRALN